MTGGNGRRTRAILHISAPVAAMTNVPADGDGSVRYTTWIETHQHDRMTLERWASGLTRVYAEGALARAQMSETATAASESLVALQEIAEVLGRRIPYLERAGEGQIAADVKEVRAAVMLRIALKRTRKTRELIGTSA
jgi:hypothetical protein